MPNAPLPSSKDLFSDIKTAYGNLGDGARKAIEAAEKGEFKIEDYRFGDIIPSLGLRPNPLDQKCFEKIEVYSSKDCSGNILNSGSAQDQLVNSFNYISINESLCLSDYDFDGSGRKYDYKVQCSNTSATI